jgi:kynurenine/2-aminoadipate aminotransferase
MPSLLTQLKAITEAEHSPSYKDWDLCVTTGSQDALTKAFEMLLSPGDILVVEAPTYPGALAYLKPMGVRFLAIPTDEHGIRDDVLREQVSALSAEDRARCRVLYTIPTGQNPAGVTASPERKKKIYDACRDLDMLILEDDPYWQLDFTAIDSDAPRQSYMSMDTDQRVLRFDSASKILSSGLRLGWASGPKLLIERLCLATQATTLHASGVPQAMAASLLKAWGVDGWRRHIDRARKGYRQRRDWMIEAIQEELGDRVEYSVPTAGMFVWLKLKNSPMRAQALIEAKAVDSKVLLLPGEAFIVPAEMCVDGQTMEGDYVRVAFSVASKEQMREGMKRFRLMLEQ